MSSRLRSLNSRKISFFAFQDIITSVSGILILVTLILATELDRNSDSSAFDANPELERRVLETLRQQAEADARNRNLQELLSSAEIAPALETLQADVARLRTQLSEEQRKQAAVAEHLTASQAAIEARDRTLGLTDLKAEIQRRIRGTEALAREEAQVRDEMKRLEQRVTAAQSRLLKLQQREGQLWLIPDKSSTTKEPILVTVSGGGVKVERFDRADQGRAFSKSDSRREFESFLREAKSLDQYFVFLVRPSGIDLFQRLVELAREKGFEVGFDALEEGLEIHFTTPPPVDEETTSYRTPVVSSVPEVTSHPGDAAKTNFASRPPPLTNSASQAAVTSKPLPAPKTKSWWQRFLDLIGLG